MQTSASTDEGISNGHMTWPKLVVKSKHSHVWWGGRGGGGGKEPKAHSQMMITNVYMEETGLNHYCVT